MNILFSASAQYPQTSGLETLRNLQAHEKSSLRTSSSCRVITTKPLLNIRMLMIILVFFRWIVSRSVRFCRYKPTEKKNKKPPPMKCVKLC